MKLLKKYLVIITIHKLGIYNFQFSIHIINIIYKLKKLSKIDVT